MNPVNKILGDDSKDRYVYHSQPLRHNKYGTTKYDSHGFAIKGMKCPKCKQVKRNFVKTNDTEICFKCAGVK